jgi:hypothetical protein
MRSTTPKPKRWGLRTLVLLAVALLSILLSTIQGYYTALSLSGLVVGLVGAMICSVRGLASLK